MFIPTKIQKDNIFGKGFGKVEMKRTLVFTVVGVVTGLLLGVFIFNENFQSILIATVAGGGAITALGYFICVKISINLSIYDYIQLILTFTKTQQFYRYKKLKEWY